MPNNRSRNRGFTLVEMLVVLAIIAVLIGLLLPAVMAAVNSARRSQIALEISQLAQALEAYKNHFGDYPPSMGEDYSPANRANTAVERHLRKCFPKISPAAKEGFYNAIDPSSGGQRLDQGEALVMWLSQIRKDPRNPFDLSSDNRHVFYDFDQTRLVDEDGDDFPAYRAKHAKNTCFIYMESKTYGAHAPGNMPAMAETTTDPLLHVRPYCLDITSTPIKAVNPTSFQIICAGQDGEFSNDTSVLKVFPGGGNYDEADQDNITNFSDGYRLQDKIP